MFWRPRRLTRFMERAWRIFRSARSAAECTGDSIERPGTEELETRWCEGLLQRVESTSEASDAAHVMLRILVPRAKDGFAAILSRDTSRGPRPIGRGLTEVSMSALARVVSAIAIDRGAVRYIESREFRSIGLYDDFSPRDRAKINRLLVARAGDSVLFTTTNRETPTSPRVLKHWFPAILGVIEERRDRLAGPAQDEPSALPPEHHGDSDEETIRVLLANLLLSTGTDQARFQSNDSTSEGLDVRVGPRRPPAVERIWREHEVRIANATVEQGRHVFDREGLAELGVDTLLGGAAVTEVIVAGRCAGKVVLTSTRPLDESQVSEPLARCTEWIARVLDTVDSIADGEERGNEKGSSGSELSVAREVVARASHELRTPMTGILGMTRFLEETEMTPEQREYLQVLRASSECLLELVNETLDGDPHRDGDWTIHPHPTRIRELITASLRTLSAIAADKRVALIIDVAPDVPETLHVDGNRLRQVVLNLVGNSLKFTLHGEVVLSVRSLPDPTGQSAADRMAFQVRDTGIGIPSHRLEAIFQDRIQAEETTRERFGGTGLGLGICRELVGRMGGRLRVESEVDVGTTFDFTLPLAIGEVAVAERTPGDSVANVSVSIDISNDTLAGVVTSQCEAWGTTIVPAESARNAETILITDGAGLLDAVHAGPRVRLAWPGDAHTDHDLALLQPFSSDDLRRVVELAANGHGSTDERVDQPTNLIGVGSSTRAVLLIDDDPMNRRLCAEYLRRSGYDPVVVPDGIAALGQVAKSEFAAILLDVSLPGLSGDEIARRMRVSGVTTPIVAVTGFSSSIIAERLEEVGVDCLLPKPIDPSALEATLARLVVGDGDAAPDVEPVFAPEIDDEELLAELVALFLETCPPILERLRAAVRLLDADEIVAAAHRLKGSSSVIGGREAAAVLEELESGPHDAKTLSRIVPRAEAALARLDERLRTFVSSRDELLRTDGCTR